MGPVKSFLDDAASLLELHRKGVRPQGRKPTGGGVGIKFLLLREILWEGSPTLMSLLMFAAYSVLPYKTRRSLANSAATLKKRMDALKPRNDYQGLEQRESR